MIRELSSLAKRVGETGIRGWLRAGLLPLKAPASDRIGEVFGVLVLGEDDAGLDSIDAATRGHKERLDIAAILGVVNGGETLPSGAIFDLLRDAFEDDSFVRALGADYAVSMGGNIFSFAGAGTSAEPESIFPPHAPDQHEVRTALE